MVFAVVGVGCASAPVAEVDGQKVPVAELGGCPEVAGCTISFDIAGALFLPEDDFLTYGQPETDCALEPEPGAPLFAVGGDGTGLGKIYGSPPTLVGQHQGPAREDGCRWIKLVPGKRSRPTG